MMVEGKSSVFAKDFSVMIADVIIENGTIEISCNSNLSTNISSSGSITNYGFAHKTKTKSN